MGTPFRCSFPVPIVGKHPANPIWREFSGGVNPDSLIVEQFRGVNGESAGWAIE